MTSDNKRLAEIRITERKTGKIYDVTQYLREVYYCPDPRVLSVSEEHLSGIVTIRYDDAKNHLTNLCFDIHPSNYVVTFSPPVQGMEWKDESNKHRNGATDLTLHVGDLALGRVVLEQTEVDEIHIAGYTSFGTQKFFAEDEDEKAQRWTEQQVTTELRSLGVPINTSLNTEG